MCSADSGDLQQHHLRSQQLNKQNHPIVPAHLTFRARMTGRCMRHPTCSLRLTFRYLSGVDETQQAISPKGPEHPTVLPFCRQRFGSLSAPSCLRRSRSDTVSAVLDHSWLSINAAKVIVPAVPLSRIHARVRRSLHRSHLRAMPSMHLRSQDRRFN